VAKANIRIHPHFTTFLTANRLVNCTPGVCAMISCTVSAGEFLMSSAVMTDVAVPTMPLNCWTAGTLPVFEPGAGATLVLAGCDSRGAARRTPDP
jgi:hypothetical protein